ncbi:hypothetical protein [Paracoccus sediminicola]|uniref:hypothetical protein n=1 Tax=Paracoccus sediminicola TaxID=3017783 RepID=UPI0022F0F321|nr:hypothetical protein [Paracoccus sediminicola]WBU57319.1 hypothetical protein PAF18_02395 [Paracoccus sediminicola]
MILRSLAYASFALAVAAPAVAQQQSPGDLAQTLFETIDADGDNALTPQERDGYTQDVVASMDLDESGGIDMDEFLNWGFGMGVIADDLGRSTQYQTASRIIYKFMDYDDDGAVTGEEMGRFQEAAFAYANQNEDGALTADEFHSHHFINIATQEALRPLE